MSHDCFGECLKETTGFREWKPGADMTPLITPRNKLLNYHTTLTLQARQVMEKKNQDYGEDGDPFRNFRAFGAFGILVRLSDKLARLRTFVERGTYMVNDESFEDTIKDAINYIILLSAMVKEREVIGNVQQAEALKVSSNPRCGGGDR